MNKVAFPIILLDGGLGSSLTEAPYNIHFDASTPLWSAHLLHTNPDHLRDLHAAFANAGADILLTASYQTSFEGFRRELGDDGDDVQAVRWMNLSTHLAQDGLEKSAHKRSSQRLQAGFTTPCLALSLGPLGATLVPSQEYSGVYPPEMSSVQALRQWHARRLTAFDLDLANGRLEFIAFETCRRIDEVRAIREVMAQFQLHPKSQVVDPSAQRETKGKRRKWWISTVWPDEHEDGEVKAMVEALLELNHVEKDGVQSSLPAPWAIGVNCTGIEKVNDIVKKMETHVTELIASGRWHDEWADETSTNSSIDAPKGPWLVLYPDGAKGLRYDSIKRTWIPTGNAKDDSSVEWHDALWEIATGIRARGRWAGLILGGCCKTTPEHIRQLRQRLDDDAAAH